MTETIHNQPCIQRIIAPKTIKRGSFFHFSIQKAFHPQTTSMHYALAGKIPKWLTIDPKSGVISGRAPMVIHDQHYLIIVTASNEYGSVQQQFTIKVASADVIEEMAQRLMEMHSLHHEIDSHYTEQASKHSMLEYIYEYFMSSDEKAVFLQQLQEHAKKLGIILSAELGFRDFQKIAIALTANIEQILSQKMTDESILGLAELTNVDFHRLFRQGSQPLGAIAIPVWNYLGAPDQYNYGEAVGNVLDAAADSVIKLRESNIEDENIHQPTPRPRR